MSDTDCLACRHPRSEHLPGRPSFCAHDNDDGWTRYDKVKRCDCLGYITYQDDPPHQDYGIKREGDPPDPPLEYLARRIRMGQASRIAFTWESETREHH